MHGGSVAPGFRTDAGRSGGAVVRTAAGVVIADPGLWLLGIIGFGVRGGLVLLTLPVLTIPSPVLLSIIFRRELGTSGTTGSFDTMVVAVAGVSGLLVLLAIMVSAWADLHAFERCVATPRSAALRLGRPPRRLAPRDRNSLLLWVAAIGAAGLVPILLITLLYAGRLGGIVATELEQPSDLGSPLVARVLRDVVPGLGVMALVVAMVEVLVSLASRRLMAARMGLLPDGPGESSESRLAARGALRLLRQPLRVMGIAFLSWATALVSAGLAMAALTLTWGATRPGLLSLSRPADPGVLVGALFTACLLSTVWLATLCLCGVAGAFRSSLWTMDTLR
jgi:hypothetical protein